jgi:hypothetical protein
VRPRFSVGSSSAVYEVVLGASGVMAGLALAASTAGIAVLLRHADG